MDSPLSGLYVLMIVMEAWNGDSGHFSWKLYVINWLSIPENSWNDTKILEIG